MARKYVSVITVLLFISSPAICRSPEATSAHDILNAGYDIMRHLEDPSDVYRRIDALSLAATSPHAFAFSGRINLPYYNRIIIALMMLLGIENAALYACLGRSKLGGGSTTACDHIPDKNIRVIRDYRKQIDAIAEYMSNVETQYQNLKNGKGLSINGDISVARRSDVTDHLYEFISKNCYNRLTCLFHGIRDQVAKFKASSSHSTTSSVSGHIYNAYLLIAVHFLKGYVVEIYQEQAYIDNPISDEAATYVKLRKIKFLMHTHVIAKLTQSALNGASRDIIQGAPSEELSESPYIQLRYVFSQVVANEASLNVNSDCDFTCEDYNGTEMRMRRPFDGNDMCNGTVLKCYHQDLGWLCPASDTTYRRYTGIKGEERSLGNVDNCPELDSTFTRFRFFATTDMFHRCDVCTCLCDDHLSPITIRTFSLKEVTSDIRNNMVITGLTLRESSGVIHIQIQESKMTDMGAADHPRWSPMDSARLHNPANTIDDLYTVRWGFRNYVNVDRISTEDAFVRAQIAEYNTSYSAESYVLTGVRFKRLHEHLAFGVRLTPWDSRARRLDASGPDRWIFNRQFGDRKEIDMHRPDVPTKTTQNVEIQGNYYVRFQPTDNEKDFGQTTVPFLDAREVATEPPMPLSGAGFYYKGKPGYGGVLGLKLVSIDFAKLIETEVKEG